MSAVRDVHHETLEAPEVSTAVYRVRRADGRYTWLETVSRAIREGGDVTEILCSSRDVTARETERLAAEDDRHRLLGQVRQVLAERLIDPVLQPIVELSTGRVAGYEALARFPLIATRPPNVWFAHAQRLGLGFELEILAVERAIELLAALPGGVWLSINASPATVGSVRMLDVVRRAPAGRLIIELTEHAEIADYPGFNTAVTALRDHGVRLAVDDTGAGFASLRHILDLRPEVIKLDMSLTRHIHRDRARRALVSALAEFALGLDADVVAEGIEEEAELEELRGLGVGLGQGYYLGRPGPLGEVAGGDGAGSG
ncbi:MAG: EAL domain-containing protein [Solirubrobacteraceae bacterium]